MISIKVYRRIHSRKQDRKTYNNNTQSNTHCESNPNPNHGTRIRAYSANGSLPKYQRLEDGSASPNTAAVEAEK